MFTPGVLQKVVLCCGVVILAAGCGGGDEGSADKVAVVPVKGTLYLDDKPHGPASLSLTPTGGKTGTGVARPQVGGAVNADGTFSLSTYGENDGAAPGDYEVALAAVSDPGSMEASLAAMNGEGAPATEPLTITIPEGGSESLEIKLVSGQKISHQALFTTGGAIASRHRGKPL